MAKKGLPEFLNKMKTDDLLRERILSIEDLDDRFAVIKSEGFEFDKDEIIQLKESIMQFSRGFGEIGGWVCCLNSGKEVK